MEENKDGFSYTYSAAQQEEIRNIRKKYADPKEDRMEYLRRLDRSVTQGATAVSVTVGVLGTLCMGGGMSLVTVGGETAFLPGVIVGLVGIGILAAAYPIYGCMVRKRREKIAPEILRLTEELMK